MKSYVPNTVEERKAMLASMGLTSMDELFADIPSDLRLNRDLAVGDGMSELEIRRVFREYAKKNNCDMPIFRGAGAYHHYIPAIVPQIVARSEFYTAYTPYQPEMSQGMLQSIFEYQTFICQLTGMEVSNASVYDAATAAAEAMHMIADAKRKKKVLVSEGMHPEAIETIKTYAHVCGVEIVTIPLNKDGVTDLAAIDANAEGAAGCFVASPNFYGCIEDLTAAAEHTHAFGGLLVASVNPMTLGALKNPAQCGADVAIGDCQPLGLPLAFGGPYAGFMACTRKLIRNIPGRIVGETADAEGTRSYVLTLQAREQHIRRDKASSNICSNQMLCAIMSSIYLACMGPVGMKEAANQNIQKAHYLADGLTSLCGMKLRYSTPYFNEFVTDGKLTGEEINTKLKAKGIMGGLPLSRVKEGDNGILWCATECNERTEIDALIAALQN